MMKRISEREENNQNNDNNNNEKKNVWKRKEKARELVIYLTGSFCPPF